MRLSLNILWSAVAKARGERLHTRAVITVIIIVISIVIIVIIVIMIIIVISIIAPEKGGQFYIEDIGKPAFNYFDCEPLLSRKQKQDNILQCTITYYDLL